MSIDPLNIGLSGLDAASAQLDVAANKIANVATPGSNVDLSTEIVTTIADQAQYKADAVVVATGDQMIETALRVDGSA